MIDINDVNKKEYFIESWNNSPFASVQNGAVRYSEIEANYTKLEKKITNNAIDEIVVNSVFASEQAITGFFYNIELTSNKSAVEFIYEYAKDAVNKFGLTPIVTTVQLPCIENKTADVKTNDAKQTYITKTNNIIQDNYPFYIGGLLLLGFGSGYLFLNNKKGKK